MTDRREATTRRTLAWVAVALLLAFMVIPLPTEDGPRGVLPELLRFQQPEIGPGKGMYTALFLAVVAMVIVIVVAIVALVMLAVNASLTARQTSFTVAVLGLLQVSHVWSVIFFITFLTEGRVAVGIICLVAGSVMGLLASLRARRSVRDRVGHRP